MVARELTLPLGKVTDGLRHHVFGLEAWPVGGQHPEVPLGEMLKQTLFWGVMVVPMGGVSTNNGTECCIDPRWAVRLLTASVAAKLAESGLLHRR